MVACVLLKKEIGNKLIFIGLLMWIKVEDELPIQNWSVRVKNGKRMVEAKYYRKKWYWWDRQLYKVTEWEKCPITYPKIPKKDLNDFFKRAKKNTHLMQKRNFHFGPIIGLLKNGESSCSPNEN